MPKPARRHEDKRQKLREKDPEFRPRPDDV
jgi:hypothetical protein